MKLSGDKFGKYRCFAFSSRKGVKARNAPLPAGEDVLGGDDGNRELSQHDPQNYHWHFIMILSRMFLPHNYDYYLNLPQDHYSAFGDQCLVFDLEKCWEGVQYGLFWTVADTMLIMIMIIFTRTLRRFWVEVCRLVMGDTSASRGRFVVSPLNALQCTA